MCRLYALRATHPTTPSCELINAQNSLVRQAERDERGLSNPHGWGIAERLADGSLDWERQAQPADESEEFRREVMETPAIATVAHVRRATVGTPRLENTHPFVIGGGVLAHNGHVGAFDRVKPRLFESLDDEYLAQIEGETDSEHVLALLMTRLAKIGNTSSSALRDCLGETAIRLGEWTRSEGASLALNVVWMVGETVIGSRLDRSLHFMERTAAYECPVCGRLHGAEHPDFRATVVASEPITQEPWAEVPDASIWWLDDHWDLQTESL